jgi:hypothetical protein
VLTSYHSFQLRHAITRDAAVRLAHVDCRSVGLPSRPQRLPRSRWVSQNGSMLLAYDGNVYPLPDYVDCPSVDRGPRAPVAAPHTVLRTSQHRPFHSLPVPVVDAACFSRLTRLGANRHVERFGEARRFGQATGHSVHWQQPTPSGDASVCVVMRFYAGQLEKGSKFTLEAALTSVLNQHFANTTILLVHTDASDVSGVHGVLSRINDARVRLVTFEDLANEPTVRVNHRTVWLATEKAVSMCPAASRWLLITNGDNTYEPSFLNHLDDAYDIMAFDYHTRHRPAWARGECDAYGYRNGLNNGCLPNNLRLCETDLGAVVLNLPRWRQEGRRFTEHESYNGSEDGLTMESLVTAGWSHKRVTGASTGGCLFDHNPNYHSCLRLSETTVWDDRAQQCLDTRDDIDALRVSVRRHGPIERCLI